MPQEDMRVADLMKFGTDFCRDNSIECTDKKLAMVARWTSLCCPDDLENADRQLMLRVLILFFHIDDHTSDDLLESCWAVLGHDTARPADRGLPQALHDLNRDIRAQAPEAPRWFADAFHDLLSAFVLRQWARANFRSVSESLYLSYRRVTIFVKPFIDLLLHFRGITHPKDDDQLEALRTRSVDWQLMVNDLQSIDRDHSEENPSLVTVLRFQSGLDQESAERLVEDAADNLEHEIWRLLAQLDLRAEQEPRLRRIHEIYWILLSGTKAMYAAGDPRYNRGTSRSEG